LYPALGLAGEAGETVDKIKKLWRNKGKTEGDQLESDERQELIKEIGDVLWYLAALATELGYPLEAVAMLNIQKLQDRQARGVIKSEGDNR
jgi:NTP pyrophosphatase (non-canonical NTP hydrolase)